MFMYKAFGAFSIFNSKIILMTFRAGNLLSLII